MIVYVYIHVYIYRCFFFYVYIYIYSPYVHVYMFNFWQYVIHQPLVFSACHRLDFDAPGFYTHCTPSRRSTGGWGPGVWQSWRGSQS